MRRFTVHLVVTILFSLHSFAQTSDESTWGSVSPGHTYIITPGGFKEPPGPGEGAGITVSPFTFIIRGTPGSEVTITLNLPKIFTSVEVLDSLPLTNWTYALPSNDGDCFYCVGLLRGDSVTVFIDSSGSQILLVGATVAVPSNAFPGGYIAGITASYSGAPCTMPSTGKHEAANKLTTDTTVERSIYVEFGWLLSIDAKMQNLSRNRSYSLIPGTDANPISPLYNGRERGTIARVEMGGNPGSQILVSTVLPTRFQSDDETYLPGLPCTYFDSSFYVEETGKYIDPRDEIILRIGTNGVVTLDIGLNLTVPADAPPGGYTAQMILSATYTGNAKSSPRMPRQSEMEVLIFAQVLDQDVPERFSLLQNYPNPFNSSTTISYGLPRPVSVKLIVYDLLGREMTTIVDGHRYAGVQSERFDSGNLPSGIYYYRIVAEGFSETKKMVIMR